MKKIIFPVLLLMSLAVACSNNKPKTDPSTEGSTTTTPIDHTGTADTTPREPEDTSRNREHEAGASLRQGQPVDNTKK